MLTVARLMIAAATTREESRGVHTRRDFPDPDPSWARHIPLRCPSLQIESAHEPHQAPSNHRASPEAPSPLAPKARAGRYAPGVVVTLKKR